MLWLILAVPAGVLGLFTIAAMVAAGRADERAEQMQRAEHTEQVSRRRVA